MFILHVLIRANLLLSLIPRLLILLEDRDVEGIKGKANSERTENIDTVAENNDTTPWTPKVGAIFESLEVLEERLHPWGHSLGFELKRMQSRMYPNPRGKQRTCIFSHGHLFKITF
jgi:hypothetical protein